MYRCFMKRTMFTRCCSFHTIKMSSTRLRIRTLKTSCYQHRYPTRSTVPVFHHLEEGLYSRDSLPKYSIMNQRKKHCSTLFLAGHAIHHFFHQPFHPQNHDEGWVYGCIIPLYDANPLLSSVVRLLFACTWQTSRNQVFIMFL